MSCRGASGSESFAWFSRSSPGLSGIITKSPNRSGCCGEMPEEGARSGGWVSFIVSRSIKTAIWACLFSFWWEESEMSHPLSRLLLLLLATLRASSTSARNTSTSRLTLFNSRPEVSNSSPKGYINTCTLIMTMPHLQLPHPPQADSASQYTEHAQHWSAGCRHPP